MRVREIIRYAVEKSGLCAPDAIGDQLWAFALAALNRVYEDVWYLRPWNNEKLVNVEVTSSTGELILPWYVDAIMGVREGLTALDPVDALKVHAIDPAAFTRTGTACEYYRLPDSPVLTQPSSSGVITFTSTSADDDGDSFPVRVCGDDDGTEYRETVDLDGTADADTENSYDNLSRLTKPETTGRITVKSGSTELGIIQPWETTPRYKRVQVLDLPDASTTYYVQATRKFEPLVSDYDSLVLKTCESAIIDLLIAELLEQGGDDERAMVMRQRANTRIAEAHDMEVEREAQDQSIYPAAPLFDGLGE